MTRLTKVCRDCGERKALQQFYRHHKKADGRMGVCKECKRAYQRRRYHEQMRDPVWREQERKRSRAKWKRLGDQWGNGPTPEQRAAHVAVGNAVRDGRLEPAERCEECDHDFSEFRREGHHPDYSLPLHVIWLCARCHRRTHTTVEH